MEGIIQGAYCNTPPQHGIMIVMVVFILFLLGLTVGSFLNVLADRLPRRESVVWGRSHCESCQHPLAWYDLVPVISCLLLRGRCRYCHHSYSVQYLLAEVGTGLMFVFLSLFFPMSTISAYALRVIICSCLLVIVLADLRYHVIPDEMVITLFIITLLSAFVLPMFAGPLVAEPSALSRLGTMGLLVAIFGGLVLITRGKGMGIGDVKYAAWMGLFLGFARGMVAFYLAFLTGAAVSVILIIWKKKSLKSAVAFGPFLVFGTLVAWWYGDSVWDWFWMTSSGWM